MEWEIGRPPREFVDWEPHSLEPLEGPLPYGKKTVLWRPGVDDAVEVPIKKLIATQPTVSRGRVDQYEKLGGHAPPKQDGTPRLPVVVAYGGRYYLHNGHHRAEAFLRLGKERMLARIVRIPRSPLRAWAER